MYEDDNADAGLICLDGDLIRRVGEPVPGFPDEAVFGYDGKKYSIDGDDVLLVTRVVEDCVHVYWVLPELLNFFFDDNYIKIAKGMMRYVGKQQCVLEALEARKG